MSASAADSGLYCSHYVYKGDRARLWPRSARQAAQTAGTLAMPWGTYCTRLAGATFEVIGGGAVRFVGDLCVAHAELYAHLDDGEIREDKGKMRATAHLTWITASAAAVATMESERPSASHLDPAPAEPEPVPAPARKRRPRSWTPAEQMALF